MRSFNVLLLQQEAKTACSTEYYFTKNMNRKSLFYCAALLLCTFVVTEFVMAQEQTGESCEPPPTEMVRIEQGEFIMGSDVPMFRDAWLKHRVSLDGFWIDATEVTNTEFARFVRETGYPTRIAKPVPPWVQHVWHNWLVAAAKKKSVTNRTFRPSIYHKPRSRASASG